MTVPQAPGAVYFGIQRLQRHDHHQGMEVGLAPTKMVEVRYWEVEKGGGGAAN